MEIKLKAAAQDSVGELPNLLLREGGYPHLPTTPIKQEPKSDAWNDAGTKPDHPCLCETNLPIGKAENIYQFWNGKFFGYAHPYKGVAIEYSNIRSEYQYVQWREVQS